MNNDINNFVPSILNPRTVNKDNFSLTQNSVVSRCSLSLKKNGALTKRNSNQIVPAKKKLFNQTTRNGNKTITNTAHCTNSITTQNDFDFAVFQELNKENTINQNITVNPVIAKQPRYLNSFELANASTVNLSSNDFNTVHDIPVQKSIDNIAYWDLKNQAFLSTVSKSKLSQDQCSLDFSVFEDLPPIADSTELNNIAIENICNISLKSGSSATELYNCEDTILHELNNQSHVSISLGIKDCQFVDLTTKNSNIKKVFITHKDNEVNLDCDIVECSPLSFESDYDENMNETRPNPQKRISVAVNLEIKKKKITDDSTEDTKVLILKTDAIDKLSHVIVQPQNCKLVKRHLVSNKFGNNKSFKSCKNGKSDKLKQTSINSFLVKNTGKDNDKNDGVSDVVILEDDDVEMNKNSAVSDLMKCITPHRPDCRGEPSPRCRVSSASKSPERSETRGMRIKAGSARSISPRKIPAVLLPKTVPNTILSTNVIPHHKIVAGTHFAVDAFSYGDIPNVKHYFLTHFHSDHYSGLRKNFCKLLYCSKITGGNENITCPLTHNLLISGGNENITCPLIPTGDLCVSRLGVNPKCIHVLNLDVTTKVEGVDITAVDANHCPGAVMLIFGMSSGKTILHTGDFRATPTMESYPLFWNSDIHTIYLDTTYCNPRYDFPTQEQSLEMALDLLRQKKAALEKVGKKFSSVLIVCGTYTIGKEKFFLSLARRVGCTVWAAPEKDKVLQVVEGRSFNSVPPRSCQLHVVPMRDINYEKLKSYLECLHGAFTEIVAFKPSGWENGKNSTVERDLITIHGIPYSEHSSFSELIRFVKFLKPKQVVPTVEISGGVKAVQKFFPCPLVHKVDSPNQSRVTDYFSIDNRQRVPEVT